MQVIGDQMEMRTESGLVMRGATHGRALAAGDAADVFVRPEAIRIARNASELDGFDNRLEGIVTSLLFNGAASRILVRDAAGEEIEVNLPQSGEYASLARGDTVQIGWDGAQGNCFPAGAA